MQGEMARSSTCQKCGAKLSIVQRFTSGKRSNLCVSCESSSKSQLQAFKNHLMLFLAGNLESVAPNLSTKLNSLSQQFNVPLTSALASCQEGLATYIEKSLAMATSDDLLDEQEEHYIKLVLSASQLDTKYSRRFSEELAHYVRKRDWSRGKLPVIQFPGYLQSGEIAHGAFSASYTRFLKSGTQEVYGQFLITNSRLIFVSDSRPFECALSKVVDIRLVGRQVSLNLTKSQGTETYRMREPELFIELLEAAVNVNNRKIDFSGTASRTITQAVKNNVWTRDGGRCVQCGSVQYLEYDHIIPFSKGGSSSENNIQILCRNCNLSKGVRI
jgi:hypothetical protein